MVGICWTKTLAALMQPEAGLYLQKKKKKVLFHANFTFRIHTTKMEWRRITCCEIALFLFEAGKFIDVLAPETGLVHLPNLSFMLTENSFVHFTIQGDF